MLTTIYTTYLLSFEVLAKRQKYDSRKLREWNNNLRFSRANEKKMSRPNEKKKKKRKKEKKQYVVFDIALMLSEEVIWRYFVKNLL